MATVNISQAAKLADISRSYFHRKYIKPGLISVTKGSDGKKQIDTSELLRVFGQLESTQVHSEQSEQEVHTSTQHEKAAFLIENGHLQEKLKLAEAQIQELKADKAWYQGQLAELASSIKLLEAPKRPEPLYPRLWWQFWK